MSSLKVLLCKLHVGVQNLIIFLYLQSLGRIPTLENGSEYKTHISWSLFVDYMCFSDSLEQSPITRRRSTEFVRTGSLPPPSRSSKRPSSATIEEEEEPETDDVPSTNGRQVSSILRRSESERRQRPSLTAGYDEVDYPKKLRSNSFGML